QQFLQDNYHFRRNVLNGKVEYVTLPEESDWRPLTPEALNSIIIRAKREQICEKGSPKTDIMEYVHSEEIETHNPIVHFLNGLPTWDEQNRVTQVFSRLPGISTEQLNFLAVWLRSAVAHWLQMDMLHGNECVPTLIGPQGCGKTKFVRRLLPQDLRQYYLEHLNLGNKFDKEMALTNNLLVNLDELEAIKPSQQAALKQTLSKNRVNGRPIYGCAQEDRLRFASFVSTTNNPHPLTDTTGNRRFICVRIPAGQYIDNSGEIDYGQLYAQVLYEIRELKSPYWFNNDEVARIQELNVEFMEQKDVAEAIHVCFRKPEEGETFRRMKSSEVLQVLRHEFPSIPNTLKMATDVGVALNALGYEFKEHGHVKFYRVIPLKAA
ncbi:MAG: DUF3874 domain-containing protein, partial [Prevotella sp.]|nr:DUF3874 domain-containing protein [Prevotella sp.]